MILDGRTFRSISNTANGTVDDRVVFLYRQTDYVVSATYDGGDVQFGQLIGIVNDDVLDARYQHVTTAGDLMTGVCQTVVETLDDGRIRLNETWQWTCGDRSKGSSIVEEISPA